MDPMMTLGIFLFFFGLFALSMRTLISARKMGQEDVRRNVFGGRPLRMIAVILLFISVFIILIFNRM